MGIKLILVILLLTTTAIGLPVSVILQDDVRLRNNTVIHSITAFRGVQNVTVRDYFTKVDVKDIETEREKFLGGEWTSVRLEIGDINANKNKIIKYEILSGNGTALLGADTYYIDGESHQLFPKEKEIDIKNRTTRYGLNLIWIAIMAVVVIVFAVYMKIGKSQCS